MEERIDGFSTLRNGQTDERPGSCFSTDGEGVSNEALILRSRNSNTEFVRTITCLPGRITFIQEDSRSGAQPFRTALVSRCTVGTVEAKIGNRAILSSEIHFVGVDPRLWGHHSVADIGREAGIPEQLLVPALSAWSLAQQLGAPTDTLTERQRKSLANCCALFIKSKVVVFEDLFSLVTPHRSLAVAQLMIDQAQKSGSIFIVVGVEEVPDHWLQNPAVVVAEEEGRRPRKPTFSPKRTGEIVLQARALMSTPTVDPAGFSTFPQSIMESTAEVHRREGLQREAIANPVIPEGNGIAGWASVATHIERQSSVTASNPKRMHRSLTRVSFIRRLTHNLLVIRWVRNTKSQLKTWLYEMRLSKVLLPPAIRLLAVKRDREERLFLRVAMFLIVVVLATLGYASVNHVSFGW